MYLKCQKGKNLKFNEKIELKLQRENCYSFNRKEKKIIIGGKFYYYNLISKKNIFFRENPEKQLGELIKRYSISDFVNNIEGEYWGIEIDYKNKFLKIFSDKLKQLELYYFDSDSFFIISESPKEILDEVGIPDYDKNSLISAILLYPPKANSLFKGLKRLKYNQTIRMFRDKISIEESVDKDTEIVKYSEKDLHQYGELLKNAILSRASKKMNLVFSSGGWDSTLILAILRKYLGKDKVIGITMKITFSDGRCFNKFEIAKVKKISRILGIKSEIIEMNYQKEDLYSRMDEVKDNLFYRGIFFLAPANWSKTVNYIKKKYGEDAVIFHGEGSDSLQNFGFSQFETLFHDNEEFRLYADKMAGYLFSPSFFKKIQDGRFLKDNVYKIFRGLYQDKEFVDVKKLSLKDKIYYYLLSFIFSDIRVPFRKVSSQRFIEESVFRNFENWLRVNYFQKAIKNINEKNLYYWFLFLYTSFHFQSPQIYVYRIALTNVRFPYIDLNLFKFFCQLPEEYGRGLEFRTTKFLEKEFAKEVLPKELVEMLVAGPHSYLYEIEDMNPYDEYWLKGSVYEKVKNKIDLKKIKKIFDSRTFRITEIEKFIQDFRQGRLKNLSSVETKLLIMITLFSIHPKA